MSGNSNPSINSPASTDHELDTLVGDNAIIAATLLRMEDDSLTDTTCAVAHGLIATIQHRSTTADQRLAESRRRINQLQGTVHAREAEICRIQGSNANLQMPAGFERNGGRDE